MQLVMIRESSGSVLRIPMPEGLIFKAIDGVPCPDFIQDCQNWIAYNYPDWNILEILGKNHAIPLDI